MSAGFRSRWLDWAPDPSRPQPPPVPAPPLVEVKRRRLPREVRDVEAHLAPVICYSCWGSDFWQSRGGVVCRRCHPPAPGAEVPG